MSTITRNSDSGGKLGLVLSGGGARGPLQVGVYERLLRDSRFADGPQVLSGTSAGALNAAMISAGFTPSEMMDFWYGLADDPPVVASARFFRTLAQTLLKIAARELLDVPRRLPRDTIRFLQRARYYWPPQLGSLAALVTDYFLTSRFDLVSEILEGIEEPFLVDTGRLRDRLVKLFGGTRVPSKRRLAINAVDIHTGRVVRYVTGPVPAVPASEYVVVPAISVDMLVASASIPLLFSPVPIGTRLLWDGGLLVNTPLAPAVALGADQIITVLVTEQHRTGSLRRFGRAVERTADSFLENAYNVDRMLLLERNRLARMDGSPYREVKLYEALRPAHDRAVFSAGSYLNFQRPTMAAMYRAGQRAATDWLAQGPPIDRLDARQNVTRSARTG
ncbi:MAG TPA: patatin-like phospholipase family protein [Candidatus Binatia bacterium]